MIKVGMLQSLVLGSLLFVLYTHNLGDFTFIDLTIPYMLYAIVFQIYMCGFDTPFEPHTQYATASMTSSLFQK